MKIHGTAKGGALSKKDFGVAFSSGGGGCTAGDDLAYTTDGSRDDTWVGWIVCMKVTGTAGECYNQIAVDLQAAGGNMRLGVYDDNSDTPNNLIAETAQLTAATGYGWNEVDEFELTTNVTWLAAQFSSTASKTKGQIIGANAYRYENHSFGAFSNPFSQDGAGTTPFTIKLGHS